MIKNKKWLIVLALYLLAISYIVFFSSTYGRISGAATKFSTINLVPFKTVSRYINGVKVVGLISAMKNILGNIVIFIPLVPILKLVLNRRITFIPAFLIGALVSFAIETIQYKMQLGVFDIDDIILNVIGVIIGVFIQGKKKSKKKRKKNISKTKNTKTRKYKEKSQ